MKKLLIAFVMLFTVFSCFNNTNVEQTEKVVRLNAVSEGASLDPQLVSDGNSNTVLGLLTEGLTFTKADGQVVPALAQSWDISEDGLTYTFHLREGIKWQDGKEITADDFVFAWSRALSPELAAEFSYLFFVVKNAEKYTKGEVTLEEVGIKALDDKTFEVKLEAPTTYFDSLVSSVSFAPANREFVTKQGTSYGLEANTLLASGPYQIESWNHNSELVLVRNANFYDKNQQKVDKYIFRYIADSSAALNAFKNDELDLVPLTTEQLEEFKGDKRVLQAGDARVNFISFQTEREIFKNHKIREGLAIALDRDNIIKLVYNGAKEPLYTFTPSNIGIMGIKEDFSKELGQLYPSHDLEKAKTLIAEGLKELGITETPTLDLLISGNQKVAEVLQSEFAEVGINIKVDLVTLKERIARQRSGEFDILLASWGGDYPDPLTFLELFISNGGSNVAMYKSENFDNFINSGRRAVKREDRVKAFMGAEKELAKDLPVVPLFQETQAFIVSEGISGFEIGAIGASSVLRNIERK